MEVHPAAPAAEQQLATGGQNQADNLDQYLPQIGNFKPNRLTVFLLNFYCNFCHIDFETEELWRKAKVRCFFARLKRLLFARQIAAWSHLIRIFFVYKTVKLFINLNLQHKYNGKLHALSAGLARGKYRELDNSTLELLHSIRDSYQQIKSLGSMYMHVNYVLECAYILILLTVWLAYLQTQCYFNLFCPLKFGLFNFMLHPEREQRNVDRIVVNEARKFLVSSQNFAHAMRLSKSPNAIELRRQCYGLRCDLNSSRLDASHQRIQSLVIRMLRTGQLQPVNRLPDWVGEAQRMFNRATLSMSLIGLVFIVSLMVVLPLANFFVGFKFELDPLDVLFCVELCVYCYIGLASASFYLALVQISCLDHIKLVKRLLDEIHYCIRLNTRLLRDARATNQPAPLGWCSRRDSEPARRLRALGLDSSTQAGASLDNELGDEAGPGPDQFDEEAFARSVYARTNSNLLKIFLHYKIFVGQISDTRDLTHFVVRVALIIMLIIPVLGRVYISYLSLSLRILVAYASLMYVFFCDLYLSLLCYFQSRCMDLYRALASLAGHTIEMSQIELEPATGDAGELGPGNRRRREVYDKHLMWLLRKELIHPQRMLERLSVVVFSSTVNYANFLRVQFWIGIITMSMIVYEPPSDQKSDYLFGDTLRIL